MYLVCTVLYVHRARMLLEFLEEVSYVWRYQALAWKHRMHMNISLLLVRFTTVLIFSIWAC